MSNTSKPKSKKFTSEELAQFLFAEMAKSHSVSKLSRKFSKSEWMFAMASAIETARSIKEDAR